MQRSALHSPYYPIMSIHFAFSSVNNLSLWWQETALTSAWYEVLSVLHMMAMLRLSQANSLLLPKTSLEGYHTKVSEGPYFDYVLTNSIDPHCCCAASVLRIYQLQF